MKKIFLGLMFLAGFVYTAPGMSAEDARWGAFAVASDADLADTGFGGGIFGETRLVDDIFVTGSAFASTYDELDRMQVLIGGEWRDRGKGSLVGYIGLQAGAEIVDSDASGSNEDMFARAYYDLGWRVGDKSEVRVGLSLDAKTETFERDKGLRLGWFTRKESSYGFYLRGELYDDETNVFAGVSWGL